jgi:hypothetical protein
MFFSSLYIRAEPVSGGLGCISCPNRQVSRLLREKLLSAGTLLNSVSSNSLDLNDGLLPPPPFGTLPLLVQGFSALFARSWGA